MAVFAPAWSPRPNATEATPLQRWAKFEDLSPQILLTSDFRAGRLGKAAVWSSPQAVVELSYERVKASEVPKLLRLYLGEGAQKSTRDGFPFWSGPSSAAFQTRRGLVILHWEEQTSNTVGLPQSSTWDQVKKSFHLAAPPKSPDFASELQVEEAKSLEWETSLWQKLCWKHPSCSDVLENLLTAFGLATLLTPLLGIMSIRAFWPCFTTTHLASALMMWGVTGTKGGAIVWFFVPWVVLLIPLVNCLICMLADALSRALLHLFHPNGTGQSS